MLKDNSITVFIVRSCDTVLVDVARRNHGCDMIFSCTVLRISLSEEFLLGEGFSCHVLPVGQKFVVPTLLQKEKVAQVTVAVKP
jgi:hypothetical protein